MSKIVTATAKGIFVYHEQSKHTHFVPYAEPIDQPLVQNQAPVVPIPYQNLQLNFIQESMYNRVINGLDAYSPEEQKSMSKRIKERIAEDFKKAQFVLRKLKVDKYYASENKLLNAIFPHIKIGSKMIDYYEGCDMPASVNLDSLGITQKQVIKSLIKHNLLPTNFFKITLDGTIERLKTA